MKHRWFARLVTPAVLFGLIPGALVLLSYAVSLAILGPRVYW
jgi:hypothetical protein